MKLKEPYTKLPVKPPLQPMLSSPEEEIPRGDEWIYEPKWDGFRAIVFKSGEHVHIGSRNSRPLERYFPELVEAFRAALPEKAVVDGEIMISTDKGLNDFGLLQMRLHPAESRVKKLSAEIPASFAAFDLIAIGDEDLRQVPFAERRARLEKMIAEKPHPKVQLTPQTRNAEEAHGWVTGNTEDGLDGVVAKKASLLYVPGQRVMVKIKPRRTADCVVGGFREHAKGQGVGSLLLGIYDESGKFVHVGHTSGFSTKDRRTIREMLRPLETKESFIGDSVPGGPSRWSPGGEEKPWIPVEPKLVCEVQFDRMMRHEWGGSFRHATGFLRWRPDKDPKECTFDQF